MDHQRVKGSFEKILNSHGYGFHYAVLELAKELKQKGKSAWDFDLVEFPVEVQGDGTRIDFILRLGTSGVPTSGVPTLGVPIFLLAECKRTNPALSDWCFARAPYIQAERSVEYAFLEYLKLDNGAQVHASSCEHRSRPTQDNAYHIALEVKSNAKGEAFGSGGRGAIEDAATQICKGLNGMIELLAENNEILGDERAGIFLPVIFTTAQIWASDVDLTSAEISTGKIDFSNHTLTKKEWLLYQYHLSPGIMHSLPPLPERPKAPTLSERPKTFGQFLDSQYIRTILVVTASGIESFLGWASDMEHYLP